MNGKRVLISIIVPIYNSSEYIQRCIDSILSQTLTNFELILINDGSTDNSIDVLKEYESKDSRIIVINKKNEGVSIARNTGIEMAKGEYIMFCDSDDYVHPQWCELLVDAIEKNIDSFVVCSYRKVNNDTLEPEPCKKMKMLVKLLAITKYLNLEYQVVYGIRFINRQSLKIVI